jgi:O-succinylbenzoate synthase
MILDGIEIFRVRMPLIYPFRTAFGDFSEIESVLVKISSGSLCGWGEASPWQLPAYSPEWSIGVFSLLSDWLAPRLLGKEIFSGEQLQAELIDVKGNQFAKAALDLAWWDLKARQVGKPLWELIGGKNDLVEVGADFGVMETIDDLILGIGQAMQAGYKRIKLKYRPGWDLGIVEAVRHEFPDGVFHIDCNSAYNFEDVEMFKILDRYDLAMIEQPLAYDDLFEHSKLQRILHTPICLDESITSPAKAAKAIEMGACRWINIKPGRVGGVTNALKIHEICEKANVPVWIGGMLESAVGASHCIALATLPNVQYPSDIFPSSRFYQRDLGSPEITLSEPGKVKPLSRPGIGREPDSDQLNHLTVESTNFDLDSN